MGFLLPLLQCFQIYRLYDIHKENFYSYSLEGRYCLPSYTNEYHPLQDWQLQMLDDIVNLACFNQGMCVYINTLT